MTPKRKKRTQPAITTIRMPPDVLDRLDYLAEQEGISRTQALVGLVRRDCKRRPRRQHERPETASVFD